MAASTFDTSGFVSEPYMEGDPPWSMAKLGRRWTWEDLPNDFLRGYVGAAVSKLNRRLFGSGGYDPAVDHFGFRHLAAATLEAMKADCGPDATGYRAVTSASMGYPNTAEGGAAFWRDRQAGMWAGFPPVTLYIDAAGKVAQR